MKIDMSHGSGGKASSDLMKNIFSAHFNNSILNKMEDAAVIELEGRTAFSTDSFVVDPLFFPGGDIGKLSVCGTVNDLSMMGAVSAYLSASFILEEGLDAAILEKIVISMSRAAEDAGVLIIGGDTKVIEGSGGLYINTSGLGKIPCGRDVSASNCRPGDVILLSGNLGNHHACILSERMKIKNNIQSDCAALNRLVEAIFDAGINVKAMRDVTRGGLGTVLNEISSSSCCGIEIREDTLPVDPEVRAFCDILGLDPVYMGNEGKMIAVVDKDDADKALMIMRSCELGKNAAVIGSFGSHKDVLMKTRLGGTRKIDMLYGEGLPRIC